MGERKSALDAALSPFERGSEIIFGLLMAISVTAAFEITAGAEVDVRELLIGALGCNLAWGLIDGAIYLLQLQFERQRNHRLVQELRGVADENAFRERVRDELPPMLAQALSTESFANFRRAVDSYAGRPAIWSGQELAAAGIICLLVFGSTFPLVIPFLVMEDAWLALRVSHAIAVIMLFALGWRIGRWSGASAFLSGAVFAMVGVALAVMCVALGG
jgi:VIT1/CCC1 family predicted Fe2+/Mn2+ transporter